MTAETIENTLKNSKIKIKISTVVTWEAIYVI